MEPLPCTSQPMIILPSGLVGADKDPFLLYNNSWVKEFIVWLQQVSCVICLDLHNIGQVRSECLTCTFRWSCCSARLSWSHVPAFDGSSVRERKKGGPPALSGTWEYELWVARYISMVDCLLTVWCTVRVIPLGGPIELYFLPVLHDWCTKGVILSVRWCI